MQCLSYAHGPSGLQRIYRTFSSLLDQQAADLSNKSAHIFRYGPTEDSLPGKTELTFGEIAERSLNVAGSLLQLGVVRGDKVALMGSNCPEWLILEYACIRIGVLLVKMPSNFLTIGNFFQTIKETKSRILVVDPHSSLKLLEDRFPDFMDTNKDFNQYGIGQIQHVILLRESALYKHDSITKFSMCAPTVELTKTIKDGEIAMNPDEPAVMFMTSGSTGLPKAVVYSHYAYINMMLNVMIGFTGKNISENKAIVVFNDRPFAWLGSISFIPMIFGCTFVHMDPAETLTGDVTGLILKVLGEENVTCAVLLQYMLFDFMKANIAIPVTLENVGTGGERIPQDIVQFSLRNFKTFILGYGATECINIGIVDAEKNTNGTIDFKWYKIQPDTEVKIVDDDGKVVPHEKVGRLLFRSPYSMSGYLINGELSKKVSDWLDLGDLAYMRKDGKFEIVGRKSDVISRGAVKVYPKMLEDILYENNKVDKAVVVGVPDPRLFQEVCACIVAKPGVNLTEAEIQQFFSAQIQANALSFAPRYYLFVDQLPKGQTGKVDKLSISKLAIDRFQLDTK